MTAPLMMQETPPPFARLLIIALGVFFIYTLFALIDQRESLRRLEQEKKRTHETAIRLRDERRALELEYLTLTRYDRIAERAADLQMVTPQPGDGNFIYLTVREK